MKLVTYPLDGVTYSAEDVAPIYAPAPPASTLAIQTLL